MRKVIGLALIVAGAVAGAQPAQPEFWQGQNIYQIITDRFFDGDPSNNNADGNYQPERSRAAHGGDFRGIERKLDYIKALGATAIWISPVVENGHGEYHGYAGRDFLKVDPRWGTLEDLRRLVDAAHWRGLLVIDDVVVNHGADLIDSGDAGYAAFKAPPDGYHLRYRNPKNTYAPPFDLNGTNTDLTNLFHNNGAINDYKIPQQVMLGELSGLDDFRTESPYVREEMARVYEYWIEAAGFDGFRIDTVKHVEPGFWQEWCPAVRTFAAGQGKPNFFMFGEVLDGSDKLCGSFTGTKGGGAFELDSVLDYPLYFKVQDVFARGNKPPSEIQKRYAGLAGNYDVSARERLVTFLDNHDQPRFLSRVKDTNGLERLRLALVFLYTSRGVPCLYYGTEQGFNGGNDPNDREDMFAGVFKDKGRAGEDSFDMTHPLFRLAAELNNFRRNYDALREGAQVEIWQETNGPGLLVYTRRLETNEVVVMLNTAAEKREVPPNPSLYLPGTKMVNLFDTNEVLAIGGIPPFLGIATTLPAFGAKIFVLQREWKPLDPTVVKTAPTHDATNASAAQLVEFNFSEPMDTNGVERAFSTEPPMAGAFAWSAAHDRMTFAPAAGGFPASTIVYARLNDSATGAASGRRLHASFEMRFRTTEAP
jgi:glycosidase